MFVVYYYGKDERELSAEFETEKEAIEFAAQVEEDSYVASIVDEKSVTQ